MDEADKIHNTELNIWEVIEQAHRGGLNYWHLLGIIIHAVELLHCKAEAEFWANMRRN